MLIDGIEINEGSVITNMSVDTGGSFPSNANAGEMFYITGDGLYVNDGTSWNAVLITDLSRNLSVGYTTDIETLASNTITPDMTLESIKSRAVDGNVTINFPTGGNGVTHILLKSDASGPYTVTLDSNVKAIGTIPDLSASTNYIATLVRETATSAMIQIQEISA